MDSIDGFYFDEFYLNKPPDEASVTLAKARAYK